MRLQSISIENFRCINNINTDFEPLTAFIGPNNSGKSTILRAVELLVAKKPMLLDSDICSTRKGSSIVISGEFNELADHALEIYREFLDADAKIEVALQADITDEGTINSPTRMIATYRSENYWFINSDAIDRLSSVAKTKTEFEIAEDEMLRGFLADWQGKKPTEEAIREFQAHWRSKHSSIDLGVKKTWVPMPKTGPLVEALPSVQFLPAELTTEDDTSLKSGSLFSRITRLLIGKLEPSFVEAQNGIQSAIALLEGESPTKIRSNFESAISSELEDWDTTARININAPNAESVFEKMFELHLDDGFASSAASKGHGLQRASFFALTRALEKLQWEAGSDALDDRPLLLIVEEPELYLHPHAQRKLRKTLEHLSVSSNAQILLATHSPQFVSYSKVKEIRRVSRQHTTRSIHQVDEDPHTKDLNPKQNHNMDYWLNPHRNEIFFADLVLLVEGQTESVVIPSALTSLGVDTTDVTVVDANGKKNLIQFMAVLNAFHIPYVVIHDEDPVKDESTYVNKDKYRNELATYQFNNDIENALNSEYGRRVMVSPDFEGMFDVSNAEVREYGKGLAGQRRLRTYLEATPPEFPQGITDIASAIRSLTR